MPVRFALSADKRLSAIAARNGVSKAELIRLAVDNFLREIEESGSVQITKRIEKALPEPLVAEETASHPIKTAPLRHISYKGRRKA